MIVDAKLTIPLKLEIEEDGDNFTIILPEELMFLKDEEVEVLLKNAK